MSTPYRILTAGCPESDVALLLQAVSDLSCDFENVHNGANCLTQLQQFQPHLVLLDTTIVDPDAFDLCRHIKRDHSAMVLILTAVSELGDIERAVDAGTDDFLCRPIKKKEIQRRMELLLALRDALP